MSQITKPGTGGGGGSGIIQTIAGDVGSITGANVTIFANNAINLCGSSVLFTNSGTVSTLGITDGGGNVTLGFLSGNLGQLYQECTAVGQQSGQHLITGGNFNSLFGFSSGELMTTGNGNTLIGFEAGYQILTGRNNTILGILGGLAYVGAESGNIIIGSQEGLVGENGVTRIGNSSSSGTPTTTCFIEGVVGNTITSPDYVTIDPSTGQLGVASGFPTSVSFQAYLSTDQAFVAGSIDNQIIYDNVVSNVGGGYDPTTGIFTAQTTAFHCFSIVTWFTDLNTAVGATMAEVAYTGNAQSLRLEQIGNGSFSQGTDLFVSSTWSMPMNAGDEIKIKPFVDGVGDYEIGGGGVSPADFNTASTFSGFSIN